MTLKLCFIVLCLQGFSVRPTFSQKSGKDVTIKLTNYEKCDSDGPDPIVFSYELNNVDSDEWKSFDLNISLKETLDDNLKFTMAVDKLNNGDWQQNVYTDEGKVCDLIKQFIKKAWENLMEAMVPKLTKFCYAEKGDYELKGYEVRRTDVNIPALYGDLRISFKVINEKGDNIACVTVWVTVSDN